MSSAIEYKCFVVEDNETITHGGLSLTGARKLLAELGHTGRRLKIHQGGKTPGSSWKPDDESRYPDVGGNQTDVRRVRATASSRRA